MLLPALSTFSGAVQEPWHSTHVADLMAFDDAIDRDDHPLWRLIQILLELFEIDIAEADDPLYIPRFRLRTFGLCNIASQLDEIGPEPGWRLPRPKNLAMSIVFV